MRPSEDLLEAVCEAILCHLPFRLAVETCGWMQMDHLIVLHRKVVPCLFQVGNLHEVAAGESLADIGVVVL